MTVLEMLFQAASHEKDAGQVSKKFEIHNWGRPILNTTSNKTFLVTSERIITETIADPSASRFSLAGGTMPKRCPRCGTRDHLGRSPSHRRRWQCRECEFIWS